MIALKPKLPKGPGGCCACLTWFPLHSIVIETTLFGPLMPFRFDKKEGEEEKVPTTKNSSTREQRFALLKNIYHWTLKLILETHKLTDTLTQHMLLLSQKIGCISYGTTAKVIPIQESWNQVNTEQQEINYLWEEAGHRITTQRKASYSEEDSLIKFKTPETFRCCMFQLLVSQTKRNETRNKILWLFSQEEVWGNHRFQIPWPILNKLLNSSIKSACRAERPTIIKANSL